LNSDDNRRLKAAADLEWPQLLAAIAGRCAGEVAAERILQMTPATTLRDARERMQLTAEALAALSLGEPVPAQAVPALGETFERVERGGVASAEELADVARLLAVARALREHIRPLREELPVLAAALSSSADLDVLLAALVRAIEPEGRVSDGASAALRDARRRVQRARSSLMDKLKQLAARHSDVLRDSSHVERDGRYGLPMRADAHRRVDGIVLGASATGATLYVQPPEVTEISNRLTLAEGDVEREIARVLAALSAEVRAMQVPLAAAYEACIKADVLAAMSRWAQQTRALAVMPDDSSSVDLRGARHPLLVVQGVEVVASDLAVESGSALIISGPNAGGKTVALKCLGLAVWMARSGIPLPVDEQSRVGWLSEVLTGIGDEQSLERSLSTFSAEVANLSAILGRADGRTLVLLDEVAGGTDPEQGAALATAVLESLVERGAAVVVTTHYERLKELAAESARFANASVGFVFDLMAPTFSLTMGMPGASSALAVAGRYGMPEEVLQRAHELLPDATTRREELLAELERERLALAKARNLAEQAADSAEELRREAEAERRTARSKERKRIAREAADLAEKVRQARAKLRALEAEAQDDKSASAARRAQRQVDDAAKLVAAGGPLARATRDLDEDAVRASVAASNLTPGTVVYVNRLGATAEVVEPPERGQVRVQAGAFSLRVPLSELRATKQPAAARQKHPPPAVQSAPPKLEAPLRTSATTCDLRGLRVDEALAEVDKFVDECLSAAEPVGFVLHGHGTGALRRAVREHLAMSGRIAESRPAEIAEGGEAFTVFWLK